MTVTEDPALAVPSPAPPPATDGTHAAARRARFGDSIRAVAARSTSSDLLRWVLLPASVLLLVGFNFMIFGWVGASRTARQIEQIPYLISGGLIGLGLVFVGALLLASAFWMALVRKLLEESETRTNAIVEALRSGEPVSQA